ncbi:LysE family translocator [Affinibrenneria salicis]|uniref:LysE family translocator n=1 Tax=Affinibrenneria salicis TaxID=2590031 RepID=A0A5J5G241_9GAMM|nr:LysE family translocator [Affinibrenneria salicis]KAA9000610.1 LysE family translocator [Affinibrenneria salicis]
MWFDTLFPAHFPALALAHFVALLSPGPDFFLLSGYAIRYRLRGSFAIAIGIAAGNGCYIALAVAGWNGIQHSPRLFSLIELAGAAYLLWIGWQLAHSRPRNGELALTAAARLPSPARQLLLGLGSSLLNPKNALFYFSLMTTILGSAVTLPQHIACGVWMTLVVLVWDSLLAALAGHDWLQRRLLRNLHWIERAAGALLIAFGLILLFNRTVSALV